MRNTYEFEINGVTRGFKFGTYSLKLISERTGMSVTDLLKEFSNSNLTVISSFYLACAEHYAASNKKDIDFTEVDVTDWLDELGVDKVGEITIKLFEQYASKNQTAPQMEGQPQ